VLFCGSFSITCKSSCGTQNEGVDSCLLSKFSARAGKTESNCAGIGVSRRLSNRQRRLNLEKRSRLKFSSSLGAGAKRKDGSFELSSAMGGKGDFYRVRGRVHEEGIHECERVPPSVPEWSLRVWKGSQRDWGKPVERESGVTQHTNQQVLGIILEKATEVEKGAGNDLRQGEGLKGSRHGVRGVMRAFEEKAYEK